MIIKSLLSADFYKLTMMQAVFYLHRDVEVEYKFKCRVPSNTKNPYTNIDLYKRVCEEIKEYCKLTFTYEEIDYLYKNPLFKGEFLQYLANYKPDFSHFTISLINDEEFDLRIKGKWVDTILYETAVLAIAQEVWSRYSSTIHDEPEMNAALKRLRPKIEKIKALNDPRFKLVDFGARRRYSANVHKEVVRELTRLLPDNFIGTSDVWLAKKYNIAPVGTMAHEWLMAYQSFCYPYKFQFQALHDWEKFYQGKLGIALSDCVGMNAFFNDFFEDDHASFLGWSGYYTGNRESMSFKKLYLRYDGCRHDSGDPFVWCDELIAEYEKNGIVPLTKTAVFSDSLTIDRAIEIFHRYKDKIKIVFGIGTHLTNDMGYNGHKPLNNVIKMVRCNGRPVAKISDSRGKQMCEDEEYIKKLAETFHINLEE